MSNRSRHARVIYAYCVSSHWQRKPPRDFVIAELDGSVIDKLRAEKQTLADEAAAYDGVAGDDTERENRKKQLTTLPDRKRLSEDLEMRRV